MSVGDANSGIEADGLASFRDGLVELPKLIVRLGQVEQPIYAAGSSLIATLRPNRGSSARCTSPIPPLPSGARS